MNILGLNEAKELGANLRSIDAILQEFDLGNDEEIPLMRKSMIHHLEKGNMEKSLYESRVLKDYLIDLTTE